MTEYKFTNWVSGTAKLIRMYGKIMRIRWSLEPTIADGKYFTLTILNSSDDILFRAKFVYHVGAANTSFLFQPFGTMDVNIDIDKDSKIQVNADEANYAAANIWLDIVQPTSAKNRQFVDNLAGLHNSSGGYAT